MKSGSSSIELRFDGLREDYSDPAVIAEQVGYTLPPRWHPLRPHITQQRFLRSETRFNVVPSGRRSGKTEIAKRRLVRKAMYETRYDGARFIAAAPTFRQAKDIFWKDLKKLVPTTLRFRPSESELTIPLVNGNEIMVTGLDEPARIEGPPVTHIIMDEIGNMKADVWPEHVRPALSDQLGTADFIGVPEGRNHYYDIAIDAQLDETGTWEYFHWKSSEILPEEEVAAARRELDKLTFEQEYDGSFVVFKAKAYYPFDIEIHAKHRVPYQADLSLIFCLDFNKAPGIAAVCQEFPADFFTNEAAFTGVVGEVHIPENSQTPIVCRKLNEDWKHHTGKVTCYGDATGGAGGSAKTEGSDWDLAKRVLRLQFPKIRFDVPRSNPRERVRVNALNSRLMSAEGDIVRLRVDPSCEQTIKDFDGVRTIPGSAGELDKKSDPKLTHLTDGIGYYVVRKHPIIAHTTTVSTY